MCVKIICSDHEHEFDPSWALEKQIIGAKEILVSYEPSDSKIDSFVGQVERMVRNGISFNVDIKVKANNYITRMKFKKQLENLKLKLNVNEIVKNICNFHNHADSKLCEISEMLEKTNE